MKSLMISLASLILLTACVEQEGKTAAPGATDARGAYANALAGEGRSAVVFDNGDVILADSARLIVEKAAARNCPLTACDPTGAIATVRSRSRTAAPTSATSATEPAPASA